MIVIPETEPIATAEKDVLMLAKDQLVVGSVLGSYSGVSQDVFSRLAALEPGEDITGLIEAPNELCTIVTELHTDLSRLSLQASGIIHPLEIEGELATSFASSISMIPKFRGILGALPGRRSNNPKVYDTTIATVFGRAPRPDELSA